MKSSSRSVAMVLNCGSSSVKYQLFRSDTSLLRGSIDNIGLESCAHKSSHTGIQTQLSGKSSYSDAIQCAIDSAMSIAPQIDCVGHRVVHGGSTLIKPTVIIPEILEQIRECSKLAPLHNPSNIKGIELAQDILASIPQVACFDTAFHALIPAKAYRYAIPRDLADKHHIRRYGFHGLSYTYIANQVKENRIIVAHLGSGCSAAAVVNGTSIDTTMGFTPMEGLVMSTRSGTVDPGVILYLANELKGDINKLSNLLNKQSGLMGLSGFTSDMKQLLSVASSESHQSRQAQEAVDVFVYTTQKMIGQLMAALEYDVDAIIFTGGIGENSHAIRHKIVQGFRGLGIELNADLNSKLNPNGVVSSTSSKIKVYAIPTNEELQIARDSLRLIQ